jgi:hypothetical protein
MAESLAVGSTSIRLATARVARCGCGGEIEAGPGGVDPRCVNKKCSVTKEMGTDLRCSVRNCGLPATIYESPTLLRCPMGHLVNVSEPRIGDC